MREMGSGDSASRLILWFCLGLLILGVGFVQCGVTYDRKALLINGQRRILFSGSIHYPRSTPDVRYKKSPKLFSFFSFGFNNKTLNFCPLCSVSYNLSKKVLALSNFYCCCCCQMWEGLIQKAKDGGIDVIETYVFWNLHEPTPGKVNFFLLFFLQLCFSFLHYVVWILMISFFLSVRFWREKWFGEIREDDSQSWFICSSSNRTLCLRRVEFRVLPNFLSCLFTFKRL